MVVEKIIKITFNPQRVQLKDILYNIKDLTYPDGKVEIIVLGNWCKSKEFETKDEEKGFYNKDGSLTDYGWEDQIEHTYIEDASVDQMEINRHLLERIKRLEKQARANWG